MRQLEAYLTLLKQLDLPLGDWKQGEVQIVTDPAEIEIIEQTMRERYAAKRAQTGLESPKDEWADSGIIYEDPFFTLVRDPVRFANGSAGVYARLIYKNVIAGTPGIALFPITSDKRVVLSKVFRHANRHHTLEVPGTIGQDGETHLQAVQRCLRTDFGLERFRKLVEVSRHFVSERGAVTSNVPFYVVEIDSPQEATDVMVRGHVLLTRKQLEQALMRGCYESEGRTYAVHDGYTAFGLLMATLHKLI